MSTISSAYPRGPQTGVGAMQTAEAVLRRPQAALQHPEERLRLPPRGSLQLSHSCDPESRERWSLQVVELDT